MSALIRSPYSRGTTAAAVRTRTVRRQCQHRQPQRRRNRQRQQLHQPLTTAAKCASWRHVLASHWCHADMRGSVNLVLCARVKYMDAGCTVCYANITVVMRIFFLDDRLCRSTLATFSRIIATFVLFRYFVSSKNIKHVDSIQYDAQMTKKTIKH